MRLVRLIMMAVLAATLTVGVGCSQGEGDRCEVYWDCADGLQCCTGSRTCQTSCTTAHDAAVPPDAAAQHDAAPSTDASPI